MYLSRVEMTGFKSFADKTTIEFDQGMTAVVGPNGSGKSNLSEAIRWVLGEQSAKSLRGTKMEDVIFNGTQARKPVNIAKVTLILNNEDRYLDLDFSEISLTRSYNRSGESQYFINNENCRLKDIVDLLLDSGLGKNSFSIISQGQVEQIFLSKPEERRTIFEEAAGVQKYQYRKTEAERKLIKSQDHLSRVKDILHELKLQLDPLKIQKEKALEYQKLNSELQKHEISLYTYQIQTSKEEWDQAEQTLNQVNNQLKELKQELDINTQKLKSKKDKNLTIDQELEDLTRNYQQLIQEIERLRGNERVIQQETKFMQGSKEDRLKELESQKNLLEQLKLQEKQARDKSKEQENDKKHLKQIIQELEEEIQSLKSDNQEELELVRSELIDLYQKKASSSNQVQVLNQKLDVLGHRLNQYKEDYQGLSNHLSHKENRQIELANQLKEVERNHYNCRQKIEQFQKNMVQEDAFLQKLKEEIFVKEKSFHRLKNQLEGLCYHQEEYVGYYSGVKAVMNQKLSGVHGPVAELIKVSSQFQTAINIALGGSWQHIVVDSDQIANQAIQYLKKESAGRATFLPLTNIKPRYIANDLLNIAKMMPGYIELGHHLVSNKAMYDSILQNLLGNCLIVEGTKNAQAIAKKLGYRVKIVTLEGDLILPGGSITGGKQKHQESSVLLRKNQLEDLEVKVKLGQEDLEASEHHYQQNYIKMQEERRLYQELRQEFEKIDKKYQEITQEYKVAKEDVQASHISLSLLKNDIKETEEEITINQEELEKYLAEVKQSETTISSNQERISRANLSEEERHEKINHLVEDLNQNKTDYAVMNVELQQTKGNLAEIQEKMTAIDTYLTSFEVESQEKDKNIAQLEESLINLQADIHKKSDQEHDILKQMDSLKMERLNLSQEIKTLEEKINQEQDSIQDLYRSSAQLEAQIEKHQAFIDNYLNYINQEYQLSYEAALLEAKEIDSIQDTQKIVKTLKTQIDSLGPINLQAIEDYNQLEERYTIISEQEFDLLQAMDQLQETMDEMDHEVIKRFGVTFEMINQQFQRTFRRLFDGGNASLELTQPDDLLTTGIDILAQPPGKKKQNLALLSGGERALTAIALLFAILETKPVPFVVLDEVEAALDDANVYRYGQYIQTFTKQTQFIVITHRKGTMEHADVLYGVTMQESGVSKLASVRLSDTDPKEDLE